MTRKLDVNHKTRQISFPDALFLANRFPVFSPTARIDGLGHFVDAGAVENSGLGTILQVLSKMKAYAPGDQDSVFYISLTSIKKGLSY